MHVRRVALSVLLGLGICSSGAAIGPVGAVVSPAPKAVSVAYGDPAVVQDSWDQPVQLTFTAAEGDLVALDSSADLECETIVLTGPDGGTVLQSPVGFHVIPSAGDYTMRYEQVCPWWGGSDRAPHAISAVQLVKGRVVPVRLGQGKVRLSSGDGYVDVARVVVRGKDGPVVLDANGGPDHRLTWDGVFDDRLLRAGHSPANPLTVRHFGSTSAGPAVVLEPGVPVSGTYSGIVRARVPHYFYDRERPRTVRLVPLRTQRLRLDGPGGRVGVGDTAGFSFRGRAGQWLRVAGGELPRTLVLRQTSGPAVVRSLLRSDPRTGGVAVWRLPETGRYRLDVLAAESDTRRSSYPIRLRRVSQSARPLVLGERLTTRLIPGRWKVHPINSHRAPDNWIHSVLVREASPGRGWTAVLLGQWSSSGIHFGCVSTAGHATDDVTEVEWLLVMPGRGRGSLDLTLERQGIEEPRDECRNLWS